MMRVPPRLPPTGDFDVLDGPTGDQDVLTGDRPDHREDEGRPVARAHLAFTYALPSRGTTAETRPAETVADARVLLSLRSRNLGMRAGMRHSAAPSLVTPLELTRAQLAQKRCYWVRRDRDEPAEVSGSACRDGNPFHDVIQDQ
jgi:hypothetical protein